MLMVYVDWRRVEDGFHDYSIVDQVVIPADLPEGDYLLSWRWDCEQVRYNII